MQEKHPVYGFYTQKTQEDWWRDTFFGTVSEFVALDSNRDALEAAFQHCYNNFEYDTGYNHKQGTVHRPFYHRFLMSRKGRWAVIGIRT